MDIKALAKTEAKQWEAAYDTASGGYDLRKIHPMLRISTPYHKWLRAKKKILGYPVEGDHVSLEVLEDIIAITQLDAYTQSVANCFFDYDDTPAQERQIIQVNVRVPACYAEQVKAYAALLSSQYDEI